MNIDDIGEKVVNCSENCIEVERRNPKKGILPRCLILEKDEKETSASTVPDFIVVGINPGIPKKSKKERVPYEQTYYINRYEEADKVPYQVLKDYFFGKAYDERASHQKPLYRKHYFNSFRDLTKAIGVGNAILWTELCKCQSMETRKLPPPQTFGTCIDKFLRKELELFPASPIIAVGDETYKVLCYMFPHKRILGVPHVRAYSGRFAQLFKQQDGIGTRTKELEDEHKRTINKWLDKSSKKNCIQIPPKSSWHARAKENGTKKLYPVDKTERQSHHRRKEEKSES